MKSRSEIWLSVLEDLGDMCSVSTQADAETMRRRVAAEGDGFFTVTLPSFGKQLERALADEVLPHSAFPGFRRRKIPVGFVLNSDGTDLKRIYRRSGVPEFLGGFMEKLFWDLDVVTDVVYADSSAVGDVALDLQLTWPPQGSGIAEMAEAVFAVRQLILLFSKEKAMAPAMAQRAAIRQYIEVDQELDRPLH